MLGPRIGYLPLLVPIIKPYFSSALPPGEDTVWFDYKGLPLKWYVFNLCSVECDRMQIRMFVEVSPVLMHLF